MPLVCRSRVRCLYADVHSRIEVGWAGQPFSRRHIYKLLGNPLYIGEIAHKGER
jgi:hypothetical protein